MKAVLRYSLDMGGHEKDLIEAAIRRRQPLPEAVQNAPSLLPGLEVIFEAYMDLATCRSTALGVERIPWTAIDQYATRQGLHGDDYEHLLLMVREMDVEFMDWAAEKRRRESNNS